MKRREFLQGLLALGAFSALGRPVQAAATRRLVMIHLFGGNDGLNTVVPWKDPAYIRARPGLALKEVLPLHSGLGFHPALAPLLPLWQRGKLAVVQGVGYPEPNRSHFISSDIWQSAGLNSNDGWLGRLAAGRGWDTVQVDDRSLCRALWQPPGASRVSLCVRSDQPAPPTRPAWMQATLAGLYGGCEQTYLGRTYARLGACQGEHWTGAPLQASLRAMLDLWPQGRLFHTSLGGFDNHSDQLNKQSKALGELATALAEFYGELQRRGWEKDTLICVYSEFGRRVEENASGGTDHGGAAPCFLLGGGVKGGLYGEHPSLTRLVDGDLSPGFDFRQVYASILEDWLEADARNVLGREFGKISCWA
ncbi:MAG: DUF1501 domain-containing protein [Vulcanimicrobiota bacterium]